MSLSLSSYLPASSVTTSQSPIKSKDLSHMQQLHILPATIPKTLYSDYWLYLLAALFFYCTSQFSGGSSLKKREQAFRIAQSNGFKLGLSCQFSVIMEPWQQLMGLDIQLFISLVRFFSLSFFTLWLERLLLFWRKCITGTPQLSVERVW